MAEKIPTDDNLTQFAGQPVNMRRVFDVNGQMSRKYYSQSEQYLFSMDDSGTQPMQADVSAVIGLLGQNEAAATLGQNEEVRNAFLGALRAEDNMREDMAKKETALFDQAMSEYYAKPGAQFAFGKDTPEYKVLRFALHEDMRQGVMGDEFFGGRNGRMEFIGRMKQFDRDIQVATDDIAKTYRDKNMLPPTFQGHVPSMYLVLDSIGNGDFDQAQEHLKSTRTLLLQVKTLSPQGQQRAEALIRNMNEIADDFTNRLQQFQKHEDHRKLGNTETEALFVPRRVDRETGKPYISCNQVLDKKTGQVLYAYTRDRAYSPDGSVRIYDTRAHRVIDLLGKHELAERLAEDPELQKLMKEELLAKKEKDEAPNAAMVWKMGVQGDEILQNIERSYHKAKQSTDRYLTGKITEYGLTHSIEDQALALALMKDFRCGTYCDEKLGGRAERLELLRQVDSLQTQMAKMLADNNIRTLGDDFSSSQKMEYIPMRLEEGDIAEAQKEISRNTARFTADWPLPEKERSEIIMGLSTIDFRLQKAIIEGSGNPASLPAKRRGQAVIVPK